MEIIKETIDLTPAKRLCRAMTKIYNARLTTVSGGNLSLRDEEGNTWVTPSGGDKGNYTEKDILKITKVGAVEGAGRPSVETAIHRAILDGRPEFKAVVHAHPPAMVAMSLLRKLPETMLLPKVANEVKHVTLATYGCPGSEELRGNVEKVFLETADTNTAILENHGAFVGAETGIEEAFGIFQDLNLSIDIEAKATSFSGQPPRCLTPEQLNDYNEAKPFRFGVFQELRDGGGAMPSKECTDPDEQNLRRAICELGLRAYNRGLLTQNIGVISVRLEGDTFIITNSGADNSELVETQLVKICGDKSESGKIPSKSAGLHKRIYEENPEVHAILMAAPANAMVFAVTELEYDLKTIPECYIVLREEISKFPFGSTIHSQDELAEYFRKKSPVAIIENDCYICTGTSLFNAFDKLEVVEFSAEAVLKSKLLGGEIKPITMKQVADIKKKFNIVRGE